MFKTCLSKDFSLTMWYAEPEITVHDCPDKMSDQIQKCSEVLKIWSDITTMYANFVLFRYK